MNIIGTVKKYLFGEIIQLLTNEYVFITLYFFNIYFIFFLKINILNIIKIS